MPGLGFNPSPARAQEGGETGLVRVRCGHRRFSAYGPSLDGGPRAAAEHGAGPRAAAQAHVKVEGGPDRWGPPGGERGRRRRTGPGEGKLGRREGEFGSWEKKKKGRGGTGWARREEEK